jgi:hypothetical protein
MGEASLRASSGCPVVSDLNGTAPRAQEWGAAQVHLRQRGFSVGPELITALRFGEVGAATAPLALALLAHGFARGHLQPRQALVWLYGEAGERSALRVGAPG